MATKYKHEVDRSIDALNKQTGINFVLIGAYGGYNVKPKNEKTGNTFNGDSPIRSGWFSKNQLNELIRAFINGLTFKKTKFSKFKVLTPAQKESLTKKK